MFRAETRFFVIHAGKPYLFKNNVLEFNVGYTAHRIFIS